MASNKRAYQRNPFQTRNRELAEVPNLEDKRAYQQNPFQPRNRELAEVPNLEEMADEIIREETKEPPPKILATDIPMPESDAKRIDQATENNTMEEEADKILSGEPETIQTRPGFSHLFKALGLPKSLWNTALMHAKQATETEAPVDAFFGKPNPERRKITGQDYADILKLKSENPSVDQFLSQRGMDPERAANIGMASEFNDPLVVGSLAKLLTKGIPAAAGLAGRGLEAAGAGIHGSAFSGLLQNLGKWKNFKSPKAKAEVQKWMLEHRNMKQN